MSSHDQDRLERRLDDLRRMGVAAAGLVARGREAYLSDDLDGTLARLAGRQLVIQVATVVEKLPESFLVEHPEVEWAKIRRMRNLVAHHYDKVLDEFVWETLRTRLPDLLERLGL